MPRYEITAPDGARYQIDGPEGSTEAEALTRLQQQLGAKPEAPSLGGAAMEAVGNIPSSAVQFGKDLVQPFLHPIETATNIKEVGAGVLQKLGLMSGEGSIEKADAVGQFFVDRYGSWDNIKKTLAKDPVGMLADVSLILSAGGAAVARAPGMVGQVGQAVATAGRVADPLMIAAKGAEGVGRAAAGTAGFMAGTGGKAVVEAATSGAKALTEPEFGQAFRDNYFKSRGVDPAEVVGQARQAVNAIAAERGKEYRAAMAKIGQDQTVLDFTKIDDALTKVSGVKVYKGQDLSPTTQALRLEMATAIKDWKVLDPQQFHTAEGLDALKQKLGDIRDGTQPRTPERLVAGQIYNAVRQTIVDQAPEYAKIMKGYEEASGIIRNLERELSLGEKANIDTGLKKLQSVLRDNVTSNYGRRAVLAEYLRDAGATTLLSALAGQSLSTVIPRGLASRLLVGAEAVAHGGIAAAGLGLNPMAIAGLGLSSPKIVGGLAHGGGLLASPLVAAGQYIPRPRALTAGAVQTGRTFGARE